MSPIIPPLCLCLHVLGAGPAAGFGRRQDARGLPRARDREEGAEPGAAGLLLQKGEENGEELGGQAVREGGVLRGGEPRSDFLLGRQAIGEPPTLELAVATLPRALRRPGRGHGEISVRDAELSVVAGPLGAAEGGWAEGASLQDPRKFPGSARGRVPSVSLLSLRRCGHAGSRSCWSWSPGSTPR